MFERLSVGAANAEANLHSSSPAIDRDGCEIAFYSDATNLVAGDTNGKTDIFVHDRTTGVTERESVASDGSQGNFSSDTPFVSGTNIKKKMIKSAFNPP